MRVEIHVVGLECEGDLRISAGSKGILPRKNFEIGPSERLFPAFPVLESS